MKNLQNNQSGAIDPLAFPFAAVVVIALVLGVFGFYSYSQLLDARNNIDTKVETQVEALREDVRTEERAVYEEKEKEPFRIFQAPAVANGIRLQYPKTWSGYVEEGNSGSTELSAHFHPNYIPGFKGDALYAARLELVDRQFSSVIEPYQRKAEKGDLAATAIAISSAKGLKFVGNYEGDIDGVLVALPIRDKTIIIWTESQDFRSDFENIILKNLVFNN